MSNKILKNNKEVTMRLKTKAQIRTLTLSLIVGLFSIGTATQVHAKNHDMLVKLAPGFTELQIPGAKTEKLIGSWFRIQSSKAINQQNLVTDPAIEFIQPNYKVSLLEDYMVHDSLRRAVIAKNAHKSWNLTEIAPKLDLIKDNPAIPDATQEGEGADPLFGKQWGMLNVGAVAAWNITRGNPDLVVAVIDTGVDYTHEDLVPNLWRNKSEIPDNGIDDDNNGFVDDIIGWDFVTNDNKPYDLYMSALEILFKGGNPGHGTHCAGNVAARGENGKGISGIAPNVKIMSLRFISEKGEGTSADAIKAIRYAVDNGAKILSNSWGSEGEDPETGAENQALREAIQYAQDHDVLFVVAAGNGHGGKGYSNDTDPKPSYPASYSHENIISVAAIDISEKLGVFSNWGQKTVHIAAPGVAIFSTTVDNKYSDIVIDKMGFKATWDGTSMACPIVAGAAALYWSAHPHANVQKVKTAIIESAKKLPHLMDKSVSGGRLDVEALLKY